MRGTQNVEMSVEDRTLIIRVNLNLDFGPSKSGKTRIIASTGGPAKIGDTVVNLNVYK